MMTLLRRLVLPIAGVASLALASTTLVPSDAASVPRQMQQLASQPASIDWQAVAQALGRSGTLMPGDVYRVGLPRTDLQVSVAGVPVQPTFALGSYAAFKQVGTGGDAMVMGDLVLLDEEVQAVMAGLFAGGISITALHNHLNEMSPHVMYMHYMGMGDPVQLATSLHTALANSGTPFGDAPAGGSQGGPQLDPGQLNAILGRTGSVNAAGVYQVSVGRAETVTDMGMELLPAMGVATAINIQPTGEGMAAVTGDFVLIGLEVNPVAQTLRAGGIAVTALHNHGLSDTPRLFYMHFWANGDVAALAGTLRAALDQTNSRPP